MGFRLAAWTFMITSVGELMAGTVMSSVYRKTPLEPNWSMTQADMLLCCLEGELQTCLLKHTRQPDLTNVLVEPAALTLSRYRSLVDAIVPRTRSTDVLRPTVYIYKVSFRHITLTLRRLDEHLTLDELTPEPANIFQLWLVKKPRYDKGNVTSHGKEEYC